MPSLPLPLSFARAQEIARGELQKLVTDATTWEVTEFQLKRISGGKWYYLIGLAPRGAVSGPSSDSFFAAMNLAGDVGLIEPRPHTPVRIEPNPPAR